uniref:Translationally-controlled tumor protein homolog n=1 Tax=Trichuris muris TaxID=70415 RepID=A0A5S6QW04_TRIMR
MIIYKDVFSGDELCSDTFPMKLVNDVVYEFVGKYVTRKIGDIHLEGSNPSAEEMDEGTDEAVERGVDIILNHQLVSMNMYQDAKIFKDWVKEYMKKLVEKLKSDGMGEAELKDFKTKMQEYVSSLMKSSRFKDLEFYVGPGEEAVEGQLGILEYRDFDGEEKPVLMLIKQGLYEEKC